MNQATKLHTDTYQDRAIEARLKIQELLQWDEMGYCKFQYEQGIAYLEAYIKEDAYRLEGSRIYWNWWKNHWYIRDCTFINENLIDYPLKNRVAIYTQINSGELLASSIHPNKVIMETSYMDMIDDFVREELQKNTNITTKQHENRG